MQSLFIAEVLWMIFNKYKNDPKSYVSLFDNTKFLIGYNFSRPEKRFKQVSESFRSIMGYSCRKFVNTDILSTNIIHSHDKGHLENFLLNLPSPGNNVDNSNGHHMIRWTRFRAKHIKDYWKNLIIFSVEYDNHNTWGLIVDERMNHLQMISNNGNHFVSNKLFSEINLNIRILNGDKIVISPRESEILEFISEGMTTGQIATKLNISLNTVTSHRKNLIYKFKVHNTAELIKKAAKLMLI